MSVKLFLMNKTKLLMETDIFQLKKKLVIMSFVLRFFLVGVEYSIILPTALLYMKTFNAGPFATGLTMAAYPIAAIISLPLFGYLYDRTKRVRELILILNLFEVVGNLIYALSFSIWLPGLGRFIAGLGDGFLALTVGELTYLYSEKDRLGIFSLMEFGRVLGLIIGPSFNFLIEGKRIVFDNWILDNNTLPGVIMALMWLLLEVLTFFCVFNLAKELINLNQRSESRQTEANPFLNGEDGYEEDGEEEEEINLINDQQMDKMVSDTQISRPADKAHSSLSRHSSEESLFHPKLKARSFSPPRSGESEDGSESSSLPPSDPDVPETVGAGIFHEHKKKGLAFLKTLKQILCVEFLIITMADFVLWFCQTNFEILCPYVTEFDYKWPPQFTGMVYVFGGIFIILVFLFLYVVGSKCNIKDSHLLIASLICTQVALALLMYEGVAKEIREREIVFGFVAAFVFISIPFNLVCSKNLLSKLFLPELMGTVQGFSSGISRITMITGPLLSGYIFKGRITYSALTSVFVFAALIAFFASLNKLEKRQKKIRKELRVSTENHQEKMQSRQDYGT